MKTEHRKVKLELGTYSGESSQTIVFHLRLMLMNHCIFFPRIQTLTHWYTVPRHGFELIKGEYRKFFFESAGRTHLQQDFMLVETELP